MASKPDLSQSVFPDSGIADYATIGVGAVNFVVLFALLGVALHFRDFPPLKAKQLSVVSLCLCSGLIWWFSAGVSNIVFPRIDAFNKTCSLWSLWGQAVFGAFMFQACILFRYYRLYRIIIQAKAFWKYSSLVFLIMMSPILATAVVLESLGVCKFDADPSFMSCYMEYWAQITIIVLFILYVLTILYFTFALRNIRKNFREYRENRYIMIVFLVLYLLLSVLIIADLTDFIFGRCLSEFVILGITNFTFFFTLGKPLYGRIRNPERCLAEFKNQLKEDLSGSYISTSPKVVEVNTSATDKTRNSFQNVDTTIKELQSQKEEA